MAATLALPGLPANWRAVGVYIANVPNSGGGQVGLLPSMLMGQMTSGGSAVPNIPVPVFSQSDVNTLFGADSMLAQEFYTYQLNDPTGFTYCTPIQDNVAGTPASIALTLGGTATAAGTLVVYVNNNAVYTGVAVSDTAATVATNCAAAINTAVANPNFPFGVTASVASAVVTITSIHKGVSAGDIQLSVNKNGAANGEFTPAGLTATVGSLVAGTGDPDLTTAFLNMATTPFSFLCCPYPTSTVNSQVNSFLSDITGRWSPEYQMYGNSFNCIRGSLAASVTYGGTVAANKHMATLPIMDSQTPAYIATAAFCGGSANSARSNPALPIVFQLQGVDSPSLINRLRRVDENTFLYNGLSTLRVDGSGNATVSRVIQNYQSNTNFLNVITDIKVAYIDTYFRTNAENKYAQMALVADGNPVQAGTTTPSLILAYFWTLYDDMVDLNIAQNSKQFRAASYVEADLQAGVVSLFLPVQTSDEVYVIRILNSFS